MRDPPHNHNVVTPKRLQAEACPGCRTNRSAAREARGRRSRGMTLQGFRKQKSAAILQLHLRTRITCSKACLRICTKPTSHKSTSVGAKERWAPLGPCRRPAWLRAACALFDPRRAPPCPRRNLCRKPTHEDEAQFRKMPLHLTTSAIPTGSGRETRRQAADALRSSRNRYSLLPASALRASAPAHSYHLSTTSAPRKTEPARSEDPLCIKTPAWARTPMRCHSLTCFPGPSPTMCSASCTTAHTTANCCCAG